MDNSRQNTSGLLKDFSRIEKEVVAGNVAKAFSLGETAFRQIPAFPRYEEFETIDNNFKTLLHYFGKGIADPQREQLYNQLGLQLYSIVADTIAALFREQNSLYKTSSGVAEDEVPTMAAIKETLEGYVSDEAMLALAPEATREAKAQALKTSHHQFLETVFNKLFMQDQWRKGMRKDGVDTLLSPTIDAFDVQNLVSAISLSSIRFFDLQKVNFLADVYRQTDDRNLRQRALVGMCFSLRGGDLLTAFLKPLVDQLAEDERFLEDIESLQKQMFFCQRTEEDTRYVEKDIMPSFLENSNYVMTSHGLKEKTPDALKDILHPEADEEAMERVEKSMNKMREMFEQGSDVFYGGFSHMKRFPFFSMLHNWFYPFTIDHPQLDEVRKKCKDQVPLGKLLQQGGFCDSDKYSLVLALGQIVDQLPPEMKEMMGTNSIYVKVNEDVDCHTDAHIRRMYLQNLYRFYRLQPRAKQAGNPFDREDFFLSLPCFASAKFDKVKTRVAKWLFRNDKPKALDRLLSTYADETDADYLLIKGLFFAASDNHSAAEALLSLNKLLAQQPDNELALKTKANILLGQQCYAGAETLYMLLVEQHPDYIFYQVSACLAKMEQGKFEEASQWLYKLYYENPDDNNVMRTLAWGQLNLGKVDQATELYDKLLKRQPVKTDYLNMGYCQWMKNRLAEAQDFFKKYLQSIKGDKRALSLLASFRKDAQLLATYGKQIGEQHLMNDAVCSVVEAE